MTATTLSQPTVVRARLSWAMAAIIALAAFASGLGVASLASATKVANGSANQAVPAFDAAKFRLEEHQGVAPAFDPARFRLDEKTAR